MTRSRADASASQGEGPARQATAIRVRLDELLSQRGMTLTELAARVDLTIANLSILKNGRARAIRFSTMARLCQALQCQPGDLLSYQPSTAPGAAAQAAGRPPADTSPTGASRTTLSTARAPFTAATGP